LEQEKEQFEVGVENRFIYEEGAEEIGRGGNCFAKQTGERVMREELSENQANRQSGNQAIGRSGISGLGIGGMGIGGLGIGFMMEKIGTNGGAYNEGTRGLRLGFWGIRCEQRKEGRKEKGERRKEKG
jgi:hypothetical protein